jgi:hypothetical protein
VLGEIGLPRHRLVVTDQRMQVPVAGVKDVADAEAAALGEGADAASTSGSFVRGTTQSCT